MRIKNPKKRILKIEVNLLNPNAIGLAEYQLRTETGRKTYFGRDETGKRSAEKDDTHRKEEQTSAIERERERERF